MIANPFDLSVSEKKFKNSFIASFATCVFFEVTNFVKSGQFKPGNDVTRNQLAFAYRLQDRINTIMQDENIHKRYCNFDEMLKGTALY